MKKLISIVSTAYNEEECVDKFYEEISKIINQIDKYDFEVVITENGSSDSTYEKLIAINKKDPRFKIIKLTRNCRADGGICAALKYAKGDAAIITYSDLEDPPHLIHDFIKKWEEGYKNVYGLIKERQCGFIRKMNSQIFYFIINKLTGNVIPKNASDFRLIDKVVYQKFNAISERNKFVRGLFAWMGYESIGVEYSRVPRAGGESKAATFLVLALAMRSIFSYSAFPLRIAGIIGIATSVMSFLGIVFIASQYLIFGKFPPFAGFGTIICVMLLMFSILFFLIGILGEYVGMIYDEVKGRPQFIVDKLIGIEKND